MEKICVKVYGGRSLFGGREHPLEAHEIYCEQPNHCTLYAQGKCLNCRGNFRFMCPTGKVNLVKGYTSRAKKYGEFKAKYTSDPLYNKLSFPQSDCFAIVGDNYWFRLEHVIAKKARTQEEMAKANAFGYILTNAYITDGDFYIPKADLNVDLLHEIFTYRPTRMWDCAEKTEYKRETIPKIIYTLKRYVPEFYMQLITKYPMYRNDAYVPNYVGQYAYTKTLRNGAVLRDCHGNEGILKDGKIYCNNYNRGFVPFDGKSASVVVELSDTATYKITDNSQVDMNTKFK